VRFRLCSAVICSLTISLAGAAGASANGNGGVSAVEPPPASSAPKPALRLDPVTGHTTNIAYKGPVYEKTATGQVVPYSPASAATGVGTLTNGTAASATGGSTATSTTTTTAPLTTTDTAEGPTPRPELLVPGTMARYVGGLAAAPMSAPPAVQEIIWAGNELIGLPYIYGGGHGSFISPGYDCSGTVSFALHGAGLISTPEDSSEFMVTQSHGIGRWVSIFSNPEHAYMTVAGLRLDTSPADDPSGLEGPRWRPLRPANPGFTVRHPLGL
jgi:cell wall-associated NlpC family hydrolase